MKTSPRGVAEIALSEALRTTAYRDSGGVLTIGYGHTSMAGPPTVTAGMVITKQTALDIFARDLAKFEKTVNEVLGVVPQNVYDAAVSFAFNCGQGAMRSASWVTAYKRGDMADAERRLKMWNKDGNPPKVVPGLVNRRAHEADVMFRNKYRVSGGLVTPGPEPVPLDLPILRKGDGLYDAKLRPYVSEAQALLRLRGFNPGVQDGKFGPGTHNMVIAFQESRRLTPDGIIGPGTWTQLGIPKNIGKAAPVRAAALDPAGITPVDPPVDEWSPVVVFFLVISGLAIAAAGAGFVLKYVVGV